MFCLLYIIPPVCRHRAYESHFPYLAGALCLLSHMHDSVLNSKYMASLEIQLRNSLGHPALEHHRADFIYAGKHGKYSGELSGICLLDITSMESSNIGSDISTCHTIYLLPEIRTALSFHSNDQTQYARQDLACLRYSYTTAL